LETLSYKTVSANSATVEKNWLLIDATGQTLGRFASKVAFLLRGKHKTNYTPHADCGDNVIVINAEKIDVTGAKLDQKNYVHYTGYPGGQRFQTLNEMLSKHPERVIEKAVKGMLPHNRLGRAVYGNMRVYVGSEHTHQGQEPQVFDINKIK
jgi:large subunit ribosomal protein L13